ncbi:MAG: NAD(P)/FAD-dependent oxidoreductase [Nitrospirota bacterium]
MKRHDVIVVGAGPIGSYTAYLLAKNSLDVGIFEKNPSIGPYVNCTGIISEECLRKFALPREEILRTVYSLRAFSPSGKYFRYHSAVPLAHIFDRSALDHKISRMAAEEGASVYLDSRVEKINVTNGTFKINVKTEGEEFLAEVVVIATGFEINYPYGQIRKPNDFLYGIQTESEVEDVNDVELYLGRRVTPGSFAWVVPTNGKSAKIGLLAKKNPAGHLKAFLQHPLLKDRVKGNNGQIKCSPIPLGMIQKSYAERLIIVGEAAGQVKTTTGGGIYFGLLCSEIAVRTILKAFKSKDFSERLFREYEINWRSKIEPELKAGMALRKLFSSLSDYQIDLLIDLASKNGISLIIKKANFDWHKNLITSLLKHIFFQRHLKK